MNSSITPNFLGLPEYNKEDEVNIVRVRKAKFLRFTERMIGYPAKIRNPEHEPMPTDKDSTIIRSVEAGLLPWPFSHETPQEYLEKWRERNREARKSDSGFRQPKDRPWGDYFYTCFFSLAPKLILMSKDDIENKEEELQGPPDTSHLPQDGSRGQARACRSNKRRCVRWFLGKWDGHYTEWEEDVMINEHF